MKPHTLLNFLGAFGLAAATVSSLDAAPTGSAFTYQGRLNFSGAPAADGLYDFKFTLHDAATLGAPVGAAVDVNAVPVTNGLFTAQLDFGTPAFTSGEARWLQLQVNTNGVTPLASLNPRQRLAPTPQAIYAGNAGTASAVAPGAVTTVGLAPDAVDGDVIFDGSISAADLAPSLLNGTFWKLGGNTGLGNFLGSVDNQPVEFRANNQAALRLLPNSTSPNLVGGHAANFVNPDGSGAFIGGGGSADNLNVANGDYAAVVGGYQNLASGVGTFVGGGSTNRATANASVVGGGTKNRAVNDYSTVAGGNNNWATGPFSAVAGGHFNTAEGTFSIIAGGYYNAAPAESAFVGGGQFNTAASRWATVGGGQSNEASGTNSTVAGGAANQATGAFSFVGGGNRNGASGVESSVVGGLSNLAAQAYSGVGSGVFNTNRGEASFIASGYFNSIDTWDSFIGSGIRNHIRAEAQWSFIGSGGSNQVNGDFAVIGGGFNNQNLGERGFVGGGTDNRIPANIFHATISGGENNSATADGATVAGGELNTSSGDYATVLGGARNIAAGDYSLAAGRRAKANHTGSFVWADDTDADFTSTTNKQFAVRANNGILIQATNTALNIRGGGSLRVEGAGVNSATPIFTHRATVANIAGPETRIDHPHCNFKPGAILILTYNFNPAGTAGVRNDRPFGLYYNPTSGRWAIYNLDATAMPAGAAYNVLVANP